MSDAPKPPDGPAAAGAPAAAALTPELDLRNRLAQLETDARTAETEMRILEGRSRNRDPKIAAAVQAEITPLKQSIEQLERALALVLVESQQRREAELAQTFEVSLKGAALEYFKKANIKEELWKNLVS